MNNVFNEGTLLLKIDEFTNGNASLIFDLETVPPGLDRGMTFSDDVPNITSLLSGKHERLSQLLDDLNFNADQKTDGKKATSVISKPTIERKDVDLLLPKTVHYYFIQLNLIVPKKKVEKKLGREWAHMVDVNQDFPEFHDLVPELAHEFPFELGTFITNIRRLPKTCRISSREFRICICCRTVILTLIKVLLQAKQLSLNMPSLLHKNT